MITVNFYMETSRSSNSYHC